MDCRRNETEGKMGDGRRKEGKEEKSEGKGREREGERRKLRVGAVRGRMIVKRWQGGPFVSTRYYYCIPTNVQGSFTYAMLPRRR